MSTLRTRSALLALALPLALGGCGGFTPLYGAQGVSPKLSAIEVTRPDGRLGFYTGEYLDDALARDRNQAPVYRLSFTNRELRVPRGITISNVASRYEVDVTTSYTLTEIATGKPVTNGQFQTNVSYDVLAQPYASLSAQQDGERRAAEQVADRMRVELASYFASPRPSAGTVTPPDQSTYSERLRVELASYFASPRPSAGTVTPPDQSTYSERLPGAVLQSPRQQAEGELQPQAGQSDTFGPPHQLTTTPDAAPQPFSPSEDPNAIKTLPAQ
jgi:LPS-assembly lipoprotein